MGNKIIFHFDLIHCHFILAVSVLWYSAVGQKINDSGYVRWNEQMNPGVGDPLSLSAVPFVQLCPDSFFVLSLPRTITLNDEKNSLVLKGNQD